MTDHDSKTQTNNSGSQSDALDAGKQNAEAPTGQVSQTTQTTTTTSNQPAVPAAPVAENTEKADRK